MLCASVLARLRPPRPPSAPPGSAKNKNKEKAHSNPAQTKLKHHARCQITQTFHLNITLPKSQSMTDSETDCPICLIHVPLLVTPCGHKACQNCFERVLLTTSPSHNYSNMTDEYPLNNVEQFEDVIIYSCPSKGRCPLCRKFIDLFDLKQCDEEGKPAGDGYKKMHDVWNSPLAGLSFGTREGDMVVQFPAADDELPSMLMLDIDTGETERELKFEDGFHYHEKSKMFLGHIDSTKVS